MSTMISVAKLHLNKRVMTFGVPLAIIAMVALISALISLLILRAGGVPGSAEWVAGSRLNFGMAYGLAGFLGYMGVQSVATTFPFALTLGATRRDFTAGTLLWAVLISAYVAVAMCLLLLLELATGHWFSDFYIFDVALLGSGNPAVLLLAVFLGTLAVLTLGGVFGASWLRFGPRGPQILGIGLLLVIAAVLLVIMPSIGEIVAAFEAWWLVIAAAVIIPVSALGTWLLLRSASVR